MTNNLWHGFTSFMVSGEVQTELTENVFEIKVSNLSFDPKSASIVGTSVFVAIVVWFLRIVYM